MAALRRRGQEGSVFLGVGDTKGTKTYKEHNQPTFYEWAFKKRF